MTPPLLPVAAQRSTACVAMTASRIGADKLTQLETLVTKLESEAAHESFDVWHSLHREFHRLIVSEAGATTVAEMELLVLRSERYQSAYQGAHLTGWWQRGEAEHRALFEAISDHNAALAGDLAGRHLARTALELLAALAPEFDTSRLRSALRFVSEGTRSF